MDMEKVKTGIFEMLQRNTWKDIDKERHRFQPVLNYALALLKEQDEELHKMQNDKNRLCFEISELKHRIHDKQFYEMNAEIIDDLEPRKKFCD